MRDFIYVNILNEGYIPWIMEKGPKFMYYTAAGIYDILSRDPRVKIEITTPELAEQRRMEYNKKIAARKKEEDMKKIQKTPQNADTLSVSDEVKIDIINKKQDFSSFKVINDESDDEIDAILAETPVEMMKSDIANAPIQQVDADGMALYTEAQISKMGKKELKAILESRGHAGGQRLVKNTDPLSPLYHDSVDDLREKVRKSQETF